MLQQKSTVHCSNCEVGQKKVTIKAHTKYRFNQCKLVVSSDTRQCKNHPSAGSYGTEHPKQETIRKCRICGGDGFIERIDENPDEVKNLPDENEVDTEKDQKDPNF